MFCLIPPDASAKLLNLLGKWTCFLWRATSLWSHDMASPRSCRQPGMMLLAWLQALRIFFPSREADLRGLSLWSQESTRWASPWRSIGGICIFEVSFERFFFRTPNSCRASKLHSYRLKLRILLSCQILGLLGQPIGHCQKTDQGGALKTHL